MSSQADVATEAGQVKSLKAPASGRALLEALLLGIMHGPAELLPISSSGHIALIPWLLGWEQDSRDPELEKAFEVALHAGTAAALAFALRADVRATVKAAPRASAELVALSFIPPAIVGFLLEGPIERRLGTPASIAGGLIAGSAAMLWADRSPQERTAEQAGRTDALWLGFAQSCALMPGVSRNGATLTAGRLRRFQRNAAERLSWHVALPVVGAATALKLARLLQHGLPAGSRAPFAVGVGSSFASTLVATRLIPTVERDAPLWPFALYRAALATTVLGKLWRARGSDAAAASGTMKS